jgi:hypothetical protein
MHYVNLHELGLHSGNRKCGACGVARPSLSGPLHYFPSSYIQSLSAAVSRFDIDNISSLPHYRHCEYCRQFMDPLSISASVAGFLGLAGQIAVTLKAYVDGVQSAPDEARSLLLEVTALCQVIEDFDGFLHKNNLNERRLESSSVLSIAIKFCRCQLEELHGKLANLSEACSVRSCQDGLNA